ncbi:hypothetical protein EWM64_g6504, partial [Hericium alpestre]
PSLALAPNKHRVCNTAMYAHPRRNATTNTHYPYAMQAGYTNYTQTAEFSLYTDAAGTSSSYQHPNGLYPANNQSDQQTGVPFQGAPPDWPSPAYHDHSAQPSVRYSQNSNQPYATADASSSSNQYASKAKLPPSKARIAGSQRTSSHSRPGDDTLSHKAEMTSMTGRMRLPIGGNAHAEAVPQSSRVGEKRKDRASSPSTSDAEALPFRKKEALRVKGHRKNRTEAIAELAERLPSHLQVYEAPSVKHIRQAIIHIDEQSARIERLEDEAGQARAAQFASDQEIDSLRTDNSVLRRQNRELLRVNRGQWYGLDERHPRP